MRLMIWLAACLLLWSGPARSEPDGVKLQASCAAVIRVAEQSGRNSVDSAMDGMFCIGLVSGVLETSKAYEKIAKVGAMCVPEEVGIQQAMRVVVNFLHDNPQHLHMRDTQLVAMSLMNAFPCKAPSGGR